MTAYLSWNCDHCGKAALIMLPSGEVYCSLCRMANVDDNVERMKFFKDVIKPKIEELKRSL